MEMTTVNLYELYLVMLEKMGPTGWWPAETKEQIIIEAILIQNTTEHNAALASKQLQEVTHYDFEKILALETEALQSIIRTAGFMKNKSKAIQSVCKWYLDHESHPDLIVKKYGNQLRKTLLNLYGIGPETADVLLTYVFEQPYFISDKYARTLFGLLGVPDLFPNYNALHQQLSVLPVPFTVEDAKEFHGLIDEFGKKYFHPVERFKSSFLSPYKLNWY